VVPFAAICNVRQHRTRKSQVIANTPTGCFEAILRSM